MPRKSILVIVVIANIAEVRNSFLVSLEISNLNLTKLLLIFICVFREAPNGLRYLRWGGDGEAVQPEK